MERTERRAVKAAERRLAESVSSDEERARTLGEEREELRRPPLGAAVAEDFGELRLHKHYLRFLRENPDGEPTPDDPPIRLAHLTVRAELSTAENCYINVTMPDGNRRSAVYPRSLFKERDVKTFENRIHRQTLDDAGFARSRESRDAELTARIDRIRTDIDRKKQAGRREVEELVEAQRTAPERIKAEQAWQRAREDWKRGTGRLPPLRARPWK
ncbi:hypothetical protein ACFPA8_10065 [Streptomyces ovatisporus]|uniref:Uncharacterized protein n=1 Tax=Streptomyces ovatisporus TaxID=1128682 RepID=A0ABV9A4U9_9ACTN